MTDRPWRHARVRVLRRAALVVALGASVLGALGPAASAAPPNTNADDRGRLDRTVRFMQDQQNADGGFGAAPKAKSDPLFSAWVALALAAAGVNPQDQRRQGGVDVYTYLQQHSAALEVTTDFERVLMVAVAAGASPRDFGGVDLVQSIISRQRPDGSFSHVAGGSRGGINDTAFAVISLSGVDDPSLLPALRRAADWLLSVQRDDGSWGWGLSSESSSDITASVIEALRAIDVTDPARETKAWTYLRTTHLEADGGFVYDPPEDESNTASTAWVVQGMWASGMEPRSWSTPSPLDYLASMQDPATGMIRWKASTLRDPNYSDNPVWMTAYAAPAFAGYPLPIPRVARAPLPTDTPAAASDEGVTSGGGGGDGAPNFSRPEPGSTGNTAGGIKDVTAESEPIDRERSGTRREHEREDDTRELATAGSNGTTSSGVTRDRSAASERRSGGAAGDLPAVGGAAGGPADALGGAVSGTVLAAPRAGAEGTGDPDAAAPGLRAADERRARALAAGLAALLALGLFAGMNLERQKVATA